MDIGNDGLVNAFREKSDLDGNLINIGYMVVEPKVFDYIDGDDSVFEQDTMNRLVDEHNLQAYVHHGFWQCMDTLREKQKLERLWNSGKAPWKVWEK